MIITEEIYQDLNKRIDNGEFLHRSPNETTEASQLPQLDQNADQDAQVFRDQCQQTLEIYQAKINALLAQLASERKKLESKEALEDACARTIDFNSLLEDKYSKLLKKSEEETKSNKKALKSLQELSDKVLEENKRLKEENEKLQSIWDYEMDEIEDCQPSKEELEALERAEAGLEEWENDAGSKSVKEVVEFCVRHVSNVDEVSESHVESIKDMLEELLESYLGEMLLDSDKLELTKKLHSIKKIRKQQINARNKEKEDNRGTTNNYYAPIGQQVNSAENVKMEIEPNKITSKYGESEPKQQLQ